MKLPASFIDYLENKTVLGSALMLAGLTVVVLLPGIWEVTSISGKDEYFLSLRTPLTMIEMDQWWVPWLDEAPRLKKPPMIYWLSRLSMEIFGPTLFAARIVSVLLAALLVYLIVRIGDLLVDHRYGIVAALITLSSMSVAVEGRRLMLDLPAATFSTLALYCLLKWWRQPRLLLLLAGATALSAAVLTKGPLGLAVFGAGALAMFLTDKAKRDLVFSKYVHIIFFALIFLALTIPWFYHVYTSYPEFSTSMLQEDVKSRQLLTISAAPISALLLLLFPWSFILVWLLFNSKNFLGSKNTKVELLITLLAWLLISLLPFFLFRSFTRYMAGSILPMAFLVAFIPYFASIQKTKVAAIASVFFVLLISLPLIIFILWFKDAWFLFVLGIIVLAYFCVTWWQCKHQEKMIWSSVVHWLVLLGLIYPAMGINHIPDKAISLVEGHKTILFQGPQPAMLAISTGKAQLRLKEINDSLPIDYDRVYTRAEDSAELERQLSSARLKYKVIYSFRTLSSRKTWIKFARKGATKEEWLSAIQSRNLEPIQSTIMLYQLDRQA